MIEADETIGAAVAERLRSDGFAVDVATDGLDGVALVAATAPDLVVLDVMLPGIDGLEVCRRIQRDRHTPVIMLTARDDEIDQLTGLAVGADDYLTKPFSPRVLVARVHALLRRTDERRQPTVLRVGSVEIDTGRRAVRRADVEHHLTPTEFELLVCLASRPGVVRTREHLVAEVWGYQDGGGLRTVDSHVRALRRKLGDDCVRTVHGVGYALAENPS